MVHEKERKKIIEQQEAQMAVKNGGKVASYIKKAIKDASEYNSHLNQERKEERCSYFDMQTQVRYKREYHLNYYSWFIFGVRAVNDSR